jgi:hypothetical protein
MREASAGKTALGLARKNNISNRRGERFYCRFPTISSTYTDLIFRVEY